MFRTAEDYSCFAAVRMREIAQSQMRFKAARERDEVMGAMLVMLGGDQQQRPDFWQQFTFDNAVIAASLTDYLLARRRERSL